MAAVTDPEVGKLAGPYVAYGYHSNGTTGADLRYSPERALVPPCPPPCRRRSTR